LLTELASKNATGTFVPPIPEGVTPPTPPARRLDDEIASMGEDIHENERRMLWARSHDNFWSDVCTVAYSTNDWEIRQQMQSLGFGDITPVRPDNNAKGIFFTFNNGQGCGVTIAGTDDATDAVEDLMFWRRTCYGTGHSNSCHAGFMQHYDKLRGQFKSLYEQHQCSRKKMIFSGHSLGGATAMVMAHDYIYSFGHPAHMAFTLTLGAPRAFTNGYVPSLGNNMVRQVNDGDPVPLVPPNAWWMFSFSYSHPAGRVHACSRYNQKHGQWNWYRSCHWWGCWGYWWYDSWWVTSTQCHLQSNDWNYSFSNFDVARHSLTTYTDLHSYSNLANPE